MPKQQLPPREAGGQSDARKAHIRAVALGGFDAAAEAEVLQHARSLPGVSLCLESSGLGQLKARTGGGGGGAQRLWV